MMILRYDDGGGFLSPFSLCLPPLIGRRRRKDGLDAIKSAFFAALELGVYDFCSLQICHSVQMGKLVCMIGTRVSRDGS